MITITMDNIITQMGYCQVNTKTYKTTTGIKGQALKNSLQKIFSSGKRYNTNITALYYNNALDTNYNVITAISRCEILTNSILVV